MEKGKSIAEITRTPVARFEVHLSKRLYQVLAVDLQSRAVPVKAIPVDRPFAKCADLLSGCIVATETCGGAHHMARRPRLLDLDARLIAGHFVTPYRMAGKSG